MPEGNTMPSQEEIGQQKERLQIYRRTLAHCLRQRAGLGSNYEPPSVSNCIDEARTEICRIKGVLRGWGEAVDDHPDDKCTEEESRGVPPLVPPSTRSATPPPSIVASSQPTPARDQGLIEEFGKSRLSVFGGFAGSVLAIL